MKNFLPRINSAALHSKMIRKYSVFTCTKCGKRRRGEPGSVHVCCRFAMAEIPGVITK